jgi:hypothetical protein
MQIRIILLSFVFSVSICQYLFCQQIYFNYRYNMCQANNDEAWSVASDILEIDEGYAFEGATVDTSNYWMRRISIFVIDNNGNKLYEKNYGNDTVDFYKGWPGSFRKSLLGEYYYLAGSKNYWQPANHDVGMVMKFDASFDTIWTKEYSLDQDKNRETSLILNNFAFCSNYDLILSGTLNGADMFLMRIDSSGNKIWHKSFHYGGNTLCTGYTAIQTSDGGFALGGFRYTIGQEETGNPVIVKTDSVGNQEWVKYMGGPLLDHAAFLANSTDGNIIMGSVYGDEMIGHEAESRINIAKLDNAGNVLWDKKYGKTIYHNYLLNIKVISDGSIIACGSNAGYYSSDMGWIIKVDQNGDSLWYREYAFLSGTSSVNRLWAVIETTDNGIAACGEILPMPPDTGNRDAWVIKLDSIGCEWAGCDTTVGIEDNKNVRLYESKTGDIDISPNPARDWIVLTFPDIWKSEETELIIYNIFGQGVMKTRAFLQNRSVSLNVSDLSPGVYLITCRDSKPGGLKGKFVISR